MSREITIFLHNQRLDFMGSCPISYLLLMMMPLTESNRLPLSRTSINPVDEKKIKNTGREEEREGFVLLVLHFSMHGWS